VSSAATCVRRSSSSPGTQSLLPDSFWVARHSNCVTSLVWGCTVCSRKQLSSSRLYLQQLSWVTVIFPLLPRLQQDKTQNYFETHSQHLMLIQNEAFTN
jgi:hypothetical protein